MKAIVVVMVTIFLTGCTNTTKVPDDILPRKKMEVILWDMIQADRFNALFQLKDSASKNVELEKFKLYEQVFAIHKTSKDDFIKSYKYYLSRPDMAKVMFDSMTAKAERLKADNYRPVPLK
ncbi:MAG TPA: DUF4296 domain-containing protein [Flavitalea sp.]|nr:DUF4296 domain-containing protein [Flavitalea sp.]